MRSHIAIFAAALALGTVAVAFADVTDSGTVIRVDHPSNVVMLEDGRMYRVTSRTVFLVGDRPTSLRELRLGQRVVIEEGEPVIFREGRYIALPPPSASPAVITQAPPPSDPPTTAKEATEVPAGARESGSRASDSPRGCRTIQSSFRVASSNASRSRARSVASPRC